MAPWHTPLRVWSLSALVACALLWLGVNLALTSSRDAWLSEGREKVASLASGYRSHVEDALDQIDQMSWFIAFQHGQGTSPAILRELLEKLPVRSPFIPLYIDANGTVLGGRTRPMAGLSVANTGFFRHHQSTTSLDLHINPVEMALDDCPAARW